MSLSTRLMHGEPGNRPRARAAVLLLGALVSAGSPARAAAQVAATGGITGSVFDSTRAIPLAGAEVFLIGTTVSTMANGEGRFFIPGLQPGAYAVAFRHARLDLLGWAAEGVPVEVRAGAVTDVQLAVPRAPPRRPVIQATPPVAPRPGSPAVIVGTVVDVVSGRGIGGASVRVRDTNIGIVTDDRGKFILFGVPAGGRTVDVRMLGYADRSTPISAVAGATFEIEIPLSTRAIELEPVVIEVRSRALDRVGFYERLEDPGGFGHFITSAEVERRAATTFSDLFTNVPGARVDYYGPGRSAVIFRRMVGTGGGDGCQPSLFVDGMMIRGTDWSFITPPMVAGVEVYVGSNIPIQYATNSCGVVLVWTQRGG